VEEGFGRRVTSAGHSGSGLVFLAMSAQQCRGWSIFSWRDRRLTRTDHRLGGKLLAERPSVRNYPSLSHPYSLIDWLARFALYLDETVA
jgi:hypothetical protein